MLIPHSPTLRKILPIAAYLLLGLTPFLALLHCFENPLRTEDTGDYIYVAFHQSLSMYRPVGYARFIHAIHHFFPSQHSVIYLQFLLQYLGLGFLTWVVTRQWNLKISFGFFLLLFLVLNLELWYLSWFLISDSLFLSVLCFFIGFCILLYFNSNSKFYIFNFFVALLLGLALFNIRYIGAFSAVFMLILMALNFRRTLALRIGFCLIIILSFGGQYLYLKSRMNAVSVVNDLSAFGGWVRANNAVAVLPDIKALNTNPSDSVLNSIHTICLSFDEDTYSWQNIRSTNFMWKSSFPGKTFLRYYQKVHGISYGESYLAVSNHFKAYGNHLIREYPFAFFKSYLLPNFMETMRHFPVSNRKSYALGEMEENYFNIKKADTNNPQLNYTYYNRTNKILYTIRWVLGLGFFLYFLIRWNALEKKTKAMVCGSLIFMGIYLGLSVWAHPINNFRYLIPLQLILSVWVVVALKELYSRNVKN